MSIQDVYKTDEHSKMIHVEDYGQWEVKKGMKVFEPNIFKRRSNFHGHEFK